MNFIEVIFFFYIFLALYGLSLFIFIYLPHRQKLFAYPKGTPEPVSIVMPCYNEGSHIGAAIESLLSLDYPKDMLEIIVVDDCSKDNSADVVRSYARKHSNVRLIVNKKNSGGAAEPTNIGIRAAKFGYIALADADSVPDRDALIKMIGFLQENPKVGGVTCSVLAKKPGNFMQKMQEIEYAQIAFTRKLLDLVDSVYVTPGPFALYRKKTLLEVGLFDKDNMTQDIEIVWRLMRAGYVARMCLPARVYSATPTKFRVWWRQRIRWTIGGFQTLVKHRREIFKKGMLGYFVVPFFSLSFILGTFGLGLFAYLFLRRLFVSWLSARYSLYADTALLHFDELTISLSVLNFFGIILFILGLAFTFFALGMMESRLLKGKHLFDILFYNVVYLTLYPILIIAAFIKLLRGNYSW